MFIHKDTKSKIKFVKNNGIIVNTIIVNNLDQLEVHKPKQLLLKDSKNEDILIRPDNFEFI